MEGKSNMESGYFIVCRNKDEDYDIDFSLKPGTLMENVPKIQSDLYSEIEHTVNVIRTLTYTSSFKKEKYFNKILSLARAGLVGDEANPYISMSALDKLKDEVLRSEGERIKARYMLKLGIFTLIYIAMITLIYIILELVFNIDHLAIYFYVSVSALIGTWFSFGVRKKVIEFNDLSIMETDMMLPSIRLIFVWIASIVFLLFVQTELVTLSIGNISSDSIQESVCLQLVFGFCCGLIESNLGNVIYKNAKRFID